MHMRRLHRHVDIEFRVSDLNIVDTSMNFHLKLKPPTPALPPANPPIHPHRESPAWVLVGVFDIRKPRSHIGS